MDLLIVQIKMIYKDKYIFVFLISISMFKNNILSALETKRSKQNTNYVMTLHLIRRFLRNFFYHNGLTDVRENLRQY